MSVVNDEVQMELDMLKAIAGEDHVDDPQSNRPDAPNGLKKASPIVKILVAPSIEVAPELILWIAFDKAEYPGGDESCVPSIVVELDPNAPIRHRASEFQEQAREAAAAEGGQMCINQVYQRILDGLAEAEIAFAKAEELKEQKARTKEEDEIDKRGSEADPTIRLGSQLTKESFADWKAKFDAERAAKRLKESGGVKKPASPTSSSAATAAATSASGSSGGGGGGGEKKIRLTGRQMWDKSLQSADWKLFEGKVGDASSGSGDGTGGSDDDGDDIDYIFGDEDDEEGEEEVEYDLGEEDEEETEEEKAERLAELEREITE